MSIRLSEVLGRAGDLLNPRMVTLWPVKGFFGDYIKSMYPYDKQCCATEYERVSTGDY